MRHTYNRPLSLSNDHRKRESRQRGRLRTDRLQCSLGEVADISASGIRLRSKRYPGVKIGKQCQITLRVDDHKVTVRVKTVWFRRIGYRHYEAGLEFVDLTPELSNAIIEIARSASLWSMQPVDRR